MTSTSILHPTFVRPTNGRWLGGVAAAVAERLDMSPRLVRLAFVIACLLPGPQELMYVAAWLLIPAESTVPVGQPAWA
jgi:phage shock protein PspC (stress-responsive transcriptional regulator)